MLNNLSQITCKSLCALLILLALLFTLPLIAEEKAPGPKLKDVPENYAANLDYAAWKDFPVGSYVDYKVLSRFHNKEAGQAPYDFNMRTRYKLFAKYDEGVVLQLDSYAIDSAVNDELLFREFLYLPQRVHIERYQWMNLPPLAQATNKTKAYKHEAKDYELSQYQYKAINQTNDLWINKQIPGWMVKWTSDKQPTGRSKVIYKSAELLSFHLAEDNKARSKFELEGKTKKLNHDYQLWKDFQVGAWVVGKLELFIEMPDTENNDAQQPDVTTSEYTLHAKYDDALVLKGITNLGNATSPQDTTYYYVFKHEYKTFDRVLFLPKHLKKQTKTSTIKIKGETHQLEHWAGEPKAGYESVYKVSKTIPGGVVSAHVDITQSATGYVKRTLTGYGLGEKKE